MRRTLLLAGIVALLVAVYAAAGYWLAPRFVREALLERAAAAGLALELDEVRTDPFAFKVTLERVRVLAGGREVARAQSAGADLAWASLWRDDWVVQEASLQRPVVRLDGALPAAPAGEGRERPRIVVRNLEVSEGTLQLVPWKLQLEAITLVVRGLSTREGERAQYELAARGADGGTVSSEGGFSVQPVSARGSVALAAVPLETILRVAAPAADSGSGQVHGSAAYAYDGERLVLQGVQLEGSRLAYRGIELAQLTLKSPRLALPSEDAFEVAAHASAPPAGKIGAAGTLALAPLRADLKLDLEHIALREAQRWVPRGVAVSIASGALSAKGRLRVRDGVRYDGALGVRGARFEEARSGALLVAWESLETEEAALRFAPFAAELGEVLARGPAARLVVDEEGRVNFAQVFTREGRPQGRGEINVSVRRLRIEEGTLDFADHSLENDFAAVVRELSGSITGFSTEPANAARVQLAGRVGEYGAARIRGRLDLDEPRSLANVTARLRNIDLASLTPYIVKFAGYRVRSGRVSAELRYEVRDGRLVGRNDLSFERLQLGEKIERAGAKELPLELAVALLADAKGRIELDIPVRGDLNDPQFDLGGLIARALGNVVGKIVSAPFRALAAVFGKRGRELGEVPFEPGRAALAPPAEEDVARIAKALQARPKLELAIRGGYDARADVAALRRQAARRAVAERAGVSADAPLDFANPRVLQAAERLYLQRVGNRLEMLALRERDRPYARLLVDALAAATPVQPGTAEALAGARAEMVRAALLAHGVAPVRVRIDAPVSAPAEDEGVPTRLALGTEGAASAGATQ